jgi:pyrroloquinoline quinone biosynthesis protein D
MTQPIELSDVYALAPHHRFQWEEAQQSYVILFPEGMVKLNGGAGEVIKRVNGQSTVGEIVTELKAAYPDADDIEQDILSMLELASSKLWIRKI